VEASLGEGEGERGATRRFGPDTRFSYLQALRGEGADRVTREGGRTAAQFEWRKVFSEAGESKGRSGFQGLDSPLEQSSRYGVPCRGVCGVSSTS
jgi:hypothetical protein